MKLFANDAALRADKVMRNQRRKLPFIAALIGITLASGSARAFALDAEGVAVAVLYDTSGSMREMVPDQNGKSSPKYVIANRALIAIANQLEAFATNATSPHKVEAGVFIFDHNTATPTVPFGSLNAEAIRSWANGYSKPAGNTPLGNALNVAGRTVLSSSLPRKHVLIITDGMNNFGPAPSAVLPKLKQAAEKKGTSFSAHFVAFDVAAKVFDPVRNQGATVVAAANEKELDSQIHFILEKKILLEDEEPPTARTKTP
jgi:von Willebrand factor type A domain